MSLKDEVLQASNRRLSLERILSELDDEDRADLEELLADEDVEATAIAVVLRRRDFNISDRTIQRYRQRLREELRG